MSVAEMLEIIAEKMNILEHVRNWNHYSPFETLIRTILSQNTTDKNSFAAFDNLKAKFHKSINPETLAHAAPQVIQDAIRIAGLHNQKSQRIKEISKIVYYEWKSDFSFIYKAPLVEARKKLMALPGIGKKTADVLLNFCGKRPILPVDTHIMRISKRIGLVPENAKYDVIREAIESLIPEKEIFTIHVSLILFGRKICKAIKPQCLTCPITHLCPKIIIRRLKSKKSRKKKQT